MYTLFDFITQVKGAEYLIAVSAIGLFILFWEVLKPRPFRSMVETAREDLSSIGQSGGYSGVFRTAGHVVAAPFIGLAYIVALPFVFLFALNLVLLEGITRAIDVTAVWMARMIVANTYALAKAMNVSTSFSWRPQEAYFLGRKRRQPTDQKED
jgi:hypothetical protein